MNWVYSGNNNGSGWIIQLISSAIFELISIRGFLSTCNSKIFGGVVFNIVIGVVYCPHKLILAFRK